MFKRMKKKAYHLGFYEGQKAAYQSYEQEAVERDEYYKQRKDRIQAYYDRFLAGNPDHELVMLFHEHMAVAEGKFMKKDWEAKVKLIKGENK